MNGELRSWVVRGNPLLAPGAGLSLCRERPQQVFARKGPAGRVYVYLKGARQQRLTFYPDGALKVESAHGEVGFTPTQGPVRYFGRRPGGCKHCWDGCTEGLQKETSWLRCGRLSAVADAPFSFRMRKGQTTIVFDGSVVLTPKKTKQNYYE